MTSGAAEIAGLVRAGRLSAREAVRAALDHVDRLDRTLHSFVQTFPDRAMARAAEIDSLVASGQGDSLPLAGVPVAIKDNICLSHGRTTCASRMLENYESPFNATAAQRLINAGAIVVGKTNLDEFAMGSSTEHSCFGPTCNPWDTSRVPGGSSGGSAAAVAARLVPLALGSDTGGSIRQPASHCGIVGLKPTYGRISRYGLVAFASSLDQIGPMTTSVADAALAMNVLCGSDEHDATSAPHAVPDFTRDLYTPVDSLTIGVPRQARSDALHPGVRETLDRSVRALQSLGATILEIDLPSVDVGIAAYYIVSSAEASSNLARYDGVRYGRRATLSPGEDLLAMYCRSRSEGLGPEVKRRIMLGTHVLSSGYYDAYYTTALKARRLILNDFQRAFAGGCHAILMPASAGPAFKLGEKTSDPLAMYLEDVFTVGVNLAGLPAISIPAGETSPARGGGFPTPGSPGANGAADPRNTGAGKPPPQAAEPGSLPVGVQLIGAAFDEATILRVARMLEVSLGLSGARPSTGAGR